MKVKIILIDDTLNVVSNKNNKAQFIKTSNIKNRLNKSSYTYFTTMKLRKNGEDYEIVKETE